MPYCDAPVLMVLPALGSGREKSLGANAIRQRQGRHRIFMRSGFAGDRRGRVRSRDRRSRLDVFRLDVNVVAYRFGQQSAVGFQVVGLVAADFERMGMRWDMSDLQSHFFTAALRADVAIAEGT